MPDQDGLAPPPIPQPRPAPIVRTPDVGPGSVGASLSGILQTAIGAPGMAPSLRGGTPGITDYVPFTGGGAGALAPVKSDLEDAVGIGNRSSVTGPLAPVEEYLEKQLGATDNPAIAAAKYVWHAINNPFTSGTDEYQTAKIRAMQQKFLNDHADVLSGMSKELSGAIGAMAGLGRMLNGKAIQTNDIDGIMKKKAALGNDLMLQIDDALSSATDPDDRAKLQAMQNDFQNWLQDRDSRVKGEWPEEARLQNCIDKLNQEMRRQAGLMQEAATSPSPRYQASTDGSVTESSVQTPQAFTYVKNLRGLLLGSQAQISGILSTGNS
jgi:hypothetical protein